MRGKRLVALFTILVLLFSSVVSYGDKVPLMERDGGGSASFSVEPGGSLTIEDVQIGNVIKDSLEVNFYAVELKYFDEKDKLLENVVIYFNRQIDKATFVVNVANEHMPSGYIFDAGFVI